MLFSALSTSSSLFTIVSVDNRTTQMPSFATSIANVHCQSTQGRREIVPNQSQPHRLECDFGIGTQLIAYSIEAIITGRFLLRRKVKPLSGNKHRAMNITRNLILCFDAREHPPLIAFIDLE
jgi:hypothetical protein